MNLFHVSMLEGQKTMIIYSKITPAAIDKIKKSEAFLAVITKVFIEDEKCLEECQLAQDMNKPMYAIIKDKEAWKKIENKFMWRQSFPAESGFEKIIKKDLEIIRAVNDA